MKNQPKMLSLAAPSPSFPSNLSFFSTNPVNLTRWGGALLELSQFVDISESKRMIGDAGLQSDYWRTHARLKIEDKVSLIQASLMDPPLTDGGIEREKLEEVKVGGPMHHCNLFDTEVTYKIAQAFLPGLASACVDNTTGGLFKSPGSVAVDIRKEMVDSLIQRSETFVAEAVVLEGGAECEVPEHPYDIISNFIDDFASSKRNFFRRVSGWLLSDRREDKIDDFVQEMEINGFWLIGRREAVSQTLLKNVDFKDAFHCNKKFSSAEELVEHLPQCGFKTIDCPNEGCDAQFTAGNMEIHDVVCPFKMLPCEQKCSDILMRHEMDRHCITVCPMKLVNCPFSSVGCVSTIPRSVLEQHKVENVHAHVLYILQNIYKEAATEDLKHRVEQLEEFSSPEQLAKAQNVRSLSTVVKNLEAKLAPLEVGMKPKTTNSEEIPSQKEESADSPAKKEERLESPNIKEVHTHPPSEIKSTDSPIENKGSKESVVARKELSSSPAKSESSIESPAKIEELLDSPTINRIMLSPAKEQHLEKSPDENDLSIRHAKKEELMDSPTKDRTMESPTNEEQSVESFAVVKESSDPPAKSDEHIELSEEHSELPFENNEGTYSSTKKEEYDESLVRKNENEYSPSEVEEYKTSPVKSEEHSKTLINGEECNGSPKKSEEPLRDRKVHEESSSSSSSEEAES